ncbi:MAG: hypothetical protein HWN65_05770 [Candidatus Helarchaeota archaeon]|nr:hypothetical protein [Candidatus Helarchaeota archaeon]
MVQFSDFQKLEFSLWVAIIVIVLMFAYYFLRRGLKKEDVPKTFNVAAGILFLGMGFRFIFSIFYYYIDHPSFYRNPIIMFLGNAVLFLGTVPLGFYLEKNVFQKTKYIISAAAMVLFAVFVYFSISSNFDGPIMLQWILPPLGIVVFIIAGGYLYLIFKTTGSVRTSATLIFIGILLIVGFFLILMFFGPYAHTPIPVVEDYLAIICPVVMMMGTFILAKGVFGYS